MSIQVVMYLLQVEERPSTHLHFQLWKPQAQLHPQLQKLKLQ